MARGLWKGARASSTGEDVPWAEVVKGYEYDDDKYVVLVDEDFQWQPEKGETEPARADVIDLMALLKKSVEKKQDKPKRAKGAQRAKRRAA
jgi:non-homologous end joining protein Ku